MRTCSPADAEQQSYLRLLRLCSIIASLDRANLSFASVCMSKELGFTAMDYGLGSGEHQQPGLGDCKGLSLFKDTPKQVT